MTSCITTDVLEVRVVRDMVEKFPVVVSGAPVVSCTWATTSRIFPCVLIPVVAAVSGEMSGEGRSGVLGVLLLMGKMGER